MFTLYMKHMAELNNNYLQKISNELENRGNSIVKNKKPTDSRSIK